MILCATIPKDCGSRATSGNLNESREMRGTADPAKVHRQVMAVIGKR